MDAMGILLRLVATGIPGCANVYMATDIDQLLGKPRENNTNSAYTTYDSIDQHVGSRVPRYAPLLSVESATTTKDPSRTPMDWFSDYPDSYADLYTGESFAFASVYILVRTSVGLSCTVCICG